MIEPSYDRVALKHFEVKKKCRNESKSYSRLGLRAPIRFVNISHGCHPILSEEELLSFFELRNYESSNSSLKTAAEFIDEYVLPSRVDLTNGQLTPNNNTPLLAQALSVMNNYQAAAAGFGPPASPHAAGGRAGFPAASSPGPALDVYGSAADSVGYVQAASPQPSGFPAIAVSRAPLNYTPGPLIPAAFTNGYH
ncbi:RNA-binding protein Musashi-like Rbp6 [Papilio xuthus]|uniref:RNA-binding protein Musashi-like Rbp6 n=1 Tax=Papilio xuthus TaxID=66420 RepID=A0A194QE64_PAPXU|nr:RNA-binding protein Musashi-like Rbp6 [Papilio xuthus]